MINKTNERKLHYRAILLNEEGIETASYYKGMYLFLGIVAGIIVNLLVALIPFHDSIKDPSYFYENTLSWIFFVTPLYGIVFVWELSYIINMDRLRSLKTCLNVALGLVICKAIIKGFVYFIWIYIKGYRYPMPFHNMIETFALFPPTFILLWFQFPENWRKDMKF